MEDAPNIPLIHSYNLENMPLSTRQYVYTHSGPHKLLDSHTHTGYKDNNIHMYT